VLYCILCCVVQLTSVCAHHVLNVFVFVN
jgi:hypothetical protein